MNKFARIIAIATAGTIPSASAASILTTSASAPTVNGADIAMLDMTGNIVGQGKFWPGEGTHPGQTFTTEGAAGGYNLNALTIHFSGGGAATKTYGVRIGTLSGGAWNKSFTAIASETFTQTTNVGGNTFLTFTLDTPVTLDPNTEYAFDVHMMGSTSGWQSGIPSVTRTNNNNIYAGGEGYTLSSWTDGNKNDTSATDLATAIRLQNSNSDFVFHLDMEEISITAIPEPSIAALVGLGGFAVMLRRRKA